MRRTHAWRLRNLPASRSALAAALVSHRCDCRHGSDVSVAPNPKRRALRSSASRKRFSYHISGHVRETFVAAVATERQACMDETEQMQIGRVVVVHVRFSESARKPPASAEPITCPPLLPPPASHIKSRAGCGRYRSRLRSSACDQTRHPSSPASNRGGRVILNLSTGPRRTDRYAHSVWTGCPPNHHRHDAKTNGATWGAYQGSVDLEKCVEVKEPAAPLAER